MMSEITIQVSWKVIDGWISQGVEYALVEIQFSKYEPQLRLFYCPIEEG